MARKNLCIWLSALAVIGLFAGCENSSDNTTQGSCSGNELKCSDGTHIQKCVEGKWAEAEVCPEETPVCQEKLNKCVECAKGSVKCKGEDQIRVCNEDGTWGNVTTCPKSTPVCDSTKNECVAGELTNKCTNGDKRCDNNGVQTCTDQSWGDAVPCQSPTPKCDEDQGNCVAECTGTATKCKDDKHVQTCSDGSWGEATECTGDTPVCVETLKTCAECTPGEKKCANGEQYKICKGDGTWGTPITCEAPTGICSETTNDCIEGTPNTPCTNDEKRCSGNTLEICSNGDWTQHPCQSPEPICDNGQKECVAECEGTETQCKDATQIQTCDGGQWGEPTECTDPTPICDSTLKNCVTCHYDHATSTGETQCTSDHKSVISCTSNGTWSDTPEACSFDSVCNEETNKCECIPDTKYCGGSGKGEGIYLCTAEKEYEFQNQIGTCQCKIDHSGCAAIENNPCETDGARACVSNSILVCERGKWTNKHTCAESELCNDAIGSVCISALRGVCKMGLRPETMCNGTELYQCENGLYTKVNYCDTSGSCMKQPYCITHNIEYGSRSAEYATTCQSTVFCDGNTIKTCDRNGQVTSETCPNGNSKAAHCILEPNTSLLPVTGQLKAECIESNDNFTYKCEGTNGTKLVYYINANESYDLVDCRVYDLSCKEGRDGGCVEE